MDPGLRSWVPVPEGSDFPIQNLPYGVFSRGGGPARAGVAIGDHVLDLGELALGGLLDGIPGLRPEVFLAEALNPFLGLGRATWRAVRERLSGLLVEGDRRVEEAGLAERTLAPLSEVELHLPFAPGDYVDFYSSIEHATNLGRMFRPEGDPLLPNWRHLPVGYHGRSGTVVVSGTPIRRPVGQTAPAGGGAEPGWGPSRLLDLELEVGFVTGPGNPLGRPIPIDRVADHILGLVLVNDWSARDLQRWEYQPLGPFLGKSFATSISPWVVTLDALAPWRVPPPPQDPEPLPYLRTDEPWGLDVELEVALAPEDAAAPSTISRTNLRGLYWTIAQQLAHATSNGAVARPGDLFASGTISGSDRGSQGSLIELTEAGRRPLELPGGATRTFLEDGDTVVLRGWCEAGRRRIGFGEVSGRVAPAEPVR
ncbi:MAG TPA: fumarylacetoacetase [Actinomycetota bacterium]